MPAEYQFETDIVLYPSRWKMAVLALGGLLFVLCAPLLWLHGGVSAKAWAVADVLFFGFCGVFALGRLLRPRPSLIVDTLGVTDNASAVGAGFVAWEEIESVTLGSMNESRFLVIVPHDARAILARQPLLKRLIMAANWSLVGSPITIPGTVSLPLAEVAAFLQARLEERTSHGNG